MFKYLRYLQKNQEGGATLEVVIITAVLIALALLFNEQIRNFANQIFQTVFNQSILEKIGY